MKRSQKPNYMAFNIELVKSVQKYPCIYDYNMKEYYNKEFVQSTWEEIAEKLNCSARECKETWKNLTIVYSRSIKKPLSGNEASKKTYYLLDLMSFLLPYMKSDKTNNENNSYSGTTSEDLNNTRDEIDDEINFLNEQTDLTNSDVELKKEYDSDEENLLLQKCVPSEFNKKK